MTVERARKLLGKDGGNYSDEQILAIINNVRKLSLACVQKIETKIATEGTSFLLNIPKSEAK